MRISSLSFFRCNFPFTVNATVYCGSLLRFKDAQEYLVELFQRNFHTKRATLLGELFKDEQFFDHSYISLENQFASREVGVTSELWRVK